MWRRALAVPSRGERTPGRGASSETSPTTSWSSAYGLCPRKTTRSVPLKGRWCSRGRSTCARRAHTAWRRIHDRPALEAEWVRARVARRAASGRAATLHNPPKDAAREGLRNVVRDVAAECRARSPAHLSRCDARPHRVASEGDEATTLRGPPANRHGLNALDNKEGCIETVEREAVIRRIEEPRRSSGSRTRMRSSRAIATGERGRIQGFPNGVKPRCPTPT